MTNPYQNEEQEREKARFAAIEAALPFVPAYGWSTEAMRRGAGEAADLLFPGGPAEMVECYIAFADARMVAGGFRSVCAP
jgi:ubiquinone biosynthesis protein COQ9